MGAADKRKEIKMQKMNKKMTMLIIYYSSLATFCDDMLFIVKNFILYIFLYRHVSQFFNSLSSIPPFQFFVIFSLVFLCLSKLFRQIYVCMNVYICVYACVYVSVCFMKISI